MTWRISAMRGRWWCSTCWRGCCAGSIRASPTCATSPTWTTRSTRAPPRPASRSPPSPRAPRRISTPTWPRSAPCRRTSSRAPPRMSPEMIALIERLIAARPRLRRRRPRAVRGRELRRLRPLSGRSPDELLAGARVEVAPYKRDPGDFVLWKPSPPDLPGWDSPWGRGRPGWHIECSAMAWRYLGETFDIHGGGARPAVPAPRERASRRSCAPFRGSGFARVWLHNGMLLMDGEKMSKSLGNFFTVRDVLDRAPARGGAAAAAARRSTAPTLEFTDDGLAEARRRARPLVPRAGRARRPRRRPKCRPRCWRRCATT